MQKILLATNNNGKVIEIKALLEELSIAVFTPSDLGLNLDIDEDGQTYAENAAKKAVAFSALSGMCTLGDDSGLEVDVLHGQPGIQSHRFCPIPNASDADRRNYLLQQLVNNPRPWTARFSTTVAIATPSLAVKLVTGTCKGEIIPEERGTNGFGYDPIFYIPETGRTMAELTLAEKNLLSHRAHAVVNAIPILKEIFGI
jgi:XTP/dITP diphosphohydrolase